MREALKSTCLVLIIAVVVFSIGLAAWLAISIISTPATMNITEANYNEALTKWRNQNVEEYEMVVGVSWANTFICMCDLEGNWTLHISPGSVQVVNQIQNGKPSTPQPNLTLQEHLDELTVEGQFRWIEQNLPDEENGAGTGKLDDRFYRVVAFHPDMGYPISIILGPKFTSFAPAMLFDIPEHRSTHVQELKVLKSHTQ